MAGAVVGISEPGSPQVIYNESDFCYLYGLYFVFYDHHTHGECCASINKRPMGHIAHLRNLGPYRNIFPISNMH
jgi:hypothetical protein